MYDLAHSIEIAKIGAGKEGYRTYPGSGGIWAGGRGGYPDATFTDWGLAKATAEILNAVLDGRLVLAAGGFKCQTCSAPMSCDCDRCRELWAS